MEKLIEPTPEDIFNFECQLRDAHSVYSRDMVRVEVYDGKHQRWILAPRRSVEKVRFEDGESRALGQKALAVILERVCNDPDGFDFETDAKINEESIILSSKIEYL